MANIRYIWCAFGQKYCYMKNSNTNFCEQNLCELRYSTSAVIMHARV